jgi:hypothetical protein
MNRARILPWFLLAAALPASAGPICDARSGTRTVPLVELYTSEGCSSCPPADRWLSKQVRSGSAHANFLAFHVDYWDGLGWHDRFGSPAYSRRQRQRVASAGGGETVYTPQVMVGSDVRVAWSEPGNMSNALQSAGGPPKASIALRLDPTPIGRWRATVAERNVGAATPGIRLWLAQYLDGQKTEVRAGENKGVTLRHDHVVARLWGPWSLADAKNQTQQVEFGTPSSPWGLVAFVQDPRGNTLQSLELPASRCEAR